MTYKRKTRDIWTLQGQYGYGWEDLTAEESFREILNRLHEYQENENGTYRIKKTKEPIEETRQDEQTVRDNQRRRTRKG